MDSRLKDRKIRKLETRIRVSTRRTIVYRYVTTSCVYRFVGYFPLLLEASVSDQSVFSSQMVRGFGSTLSMLMPTLLFLL